MTLTSHLQNPCRDNETSLTIVRRVGQAGDIGRVLTRRDIKEKKDIVRTLPIAVLTLMIKTYVIGLMILSKVDSTAITTTITTTINTTTTRERIKIMDPDNPVTGTITTIRNASIHITTNVTVINRTPGTTAMSNTIMNKGTIE